MKKAPTYPPLSACASDLFTIQEGNTISKAPKKEAAKIIKITKKNTLGTQLVLNQLIKSGPNNIEKMCIRDSPKTRDKNRNQEK